MQREWQAIRELDREIKNLERSSKKLEGDIKKAGRDNQIVSVADVAERLLLHISFRMQLEWWPRI